MNFLAPLFLLGAFAVALPIVFHLLRRTARERTLFSSLMFLRQSPPQFTRRRRFEHLLLLLLRCAVVGLLAAGFARPFLRQATVVPPAQAPANQTVVLLDTSASMRRSGLWPAARDLALAAARQCQPSDQLAIYAFDQRTRQVLAFADWVQSPVADRVAMARGRLNELTPSWLATDLAAALTTAAELLSTREVSALIAQRRIVLISDLQEGSRMDLLRSYDWPKGIELVIQPVQTKPSGNAHLQRLAHRSDSPSAAATKLRIRISSTPDAALESFQAGWNRPDNNGWLSTPVEVYVPPGQTRVIDLPALESTNAGCIRLAGDNVEFDNRLFVVKSDPEHSKVLYLGQETEQDTRQPAFFLRRALRETPRWIVTMNQLNPKTSLDDKSVADAALVVITDKLADSAVQILRRQITAGKTVLFVPKTPDAMDTVATVLGRARWNIEEALSPKYALWAEMDFGHPLLAAFADPRFSDFTKIHFWRYRRLASSDITGIRVLIRFDNGDPALIEAPLGRGRVMLMTSGWHPEDSQLALSSKFVPLIYSMIELGTGPQTQDASQYLVGDVISLRQPASVLQAPGTMVLPDGKRIPLEPGTTNFLETALPGVYCYIAGGMTQWFALNLAAAESRTQPMPVDELERLGPSHTPRAFTRDQVRERSGVQQNAALEGRQKMWRWFLVAALLVLLIESWLAGWTSRRASSAEVVSASVPPEPQAES